MVTVTCAGDHHMAFLLMGEEAMVAQASKKSDKRTEYGVTAEEFLVIWNTSDTLDEVVEKTGMPRAIVHARASNYRSQDLVLKQFPRPKRGLDVEALNRRIEEATRAKTRGRPAKAVGLRVAPRTTASTRKSR